MNPTAATDSLRAAADVALFHARVEHGEGDRCRRLDQHSAAAASYREAARLYRYAADRLAHAADIDGRPQDHTIVDAHRVEAARLDGLAAGLTEGAA